MFYVTTPIYYVNDRPHIGTAYCTIMADIAARFHRLRGEEVFFLTGTDENGLKVATAAREKGYEPMEFVDMMADLYRQAWTGLGISFDDFIRTTEPRHKTAVQTIFAVLKDRGDIYLGEYEGWYCLSDETYFTDSDVTDGRCPNPHCGRPLTRMKQPAYYFRASKYVPWLLKHLEANPDFLLPDFRRNEVVSFLEGGMRDCCVSRLNPGWGIEVPGDPGHVVYVWFDALVNYIAAAGYPHDGERFQAIWLNAHHIVGKEIYTRFHASLWPMMLKAAELPLPVLVYGHGFWHFKDRKISKSTGALVEPFELADMLSRTSGVSREIAIDALRYFLAREMVFGQDAEFSSEALKTRFNADLANDLGNLLNRTAPLLEREFGGKVPQATTESNVAKAVSESIQAAEAALVQFNYNGALASLWAGLAVLNRYLDQTAPWAMSGKNQREAMGRCLYTTLDGLRMIAEALAPFMPNVSAEILRRLGLEAAHLEWKQAETPALLPAGSRVAGGAPLFPRIERETPLVLEEAAVVSEVQAGPTELTIEEFSKVDLRVALVTKVEKVPKTEKLLEITLDLGTSQRTVVAGIGDKYSPEGLVGKRLVLVANLKPVKVRGVLSQGMILAAGDKEVAGLVVLDKDVPPGTKVR